MHSNPVTINRRDSLIFKSCWRRQRKSLERRGRRLFAEPCRAVSPSVDALADQAIVKVICLVDHTWCQRCLELPDFADRLDRLWKPLAHIRG
jgi:hypothetical protein